MRPPSDATIAAFRKWLFGIVGPTAGFLLLVGSIVTGTLTTETFGGAGFLMLLKLGDTPPSPPSPPTAPPLAS